MGLGRRTASHTCLSSSPCAPQPCLQAQGDKQAHLFVDPLNFRSLEQEVCSRPTGQTEPLGFLSLRTVSARPRAQGWSPGQVTVRLRLRRLETCFHNGLAWMARHVSRMDRVGRGGWAGRQRPITDPSALLWSPRRQGEKSLWFDSLQKGH